MEIQYSSSIFFNTRATKSTMHSSVHLFQIFFTLQSPMSRFLLNLVQHFEKLKFLAHTVKEKWKETRKVFMTHTEWQIKLSDSYLTKVCAHSWAVCVVTCAKLCLCLFSLSSGFMVNAMKIELATSVIFHGFTRRAPAPRDCAAPANWNREKREK